MGGPTAWSRPQVERTAEAKRQSERDKRKALWDSAPSTFEDISDRARPTANSWEHSELGSAKQNAKFLRLLGGKELVNDAGKDSDGVQRDGVEVISDEESFEDANLPKDCPVFELTTGCDFVPVERGTEETAVAFVTTSASTDAASESSQRGGNTIDRELERQYAQGLQYCRARGQG